MGPTKDSTSWNKQKHQDNQIGVQNIYSNKWKKQETVNKKPMKGKCLQKPKNRGDKNNKILFSQISKN